MTCNILLFIYWTYQGVLSIKCPLKMSHFFARRQTTTKHSFGSWHLFTILLCKRVIAKKWQPYSVNHAIFWLRVNCQHLAPLCKNAASACLIFCDFSVLTQATVMSGSLSSAGSSISSVQVSKMSSPCYTHRLSKTQQLLIIVGILKMLTPVFFNRNIPQSYVCN